MDKANKTYKWSKAMQEKQESSARKDDFPEGKQIIPEGKDNKEEKKIIM